MPSMRKVTFRVRSSKTFGSSIKATSNDTQLSLAPDAPYGAPVKAALERMKIYVTRDSVAMGDDIDAPHEQHYSYPDSMPIEEAIEKIVSSNYLAKVQGGATWSVVSGFPIAVVAQRWEKPQPVSWQPVTLSSLQFQNNMVGLHFNYHAQLDPEIVLKVLKELRVLPRFSGRLS